MSISLKKHSFASAVLILALMVPRSAIAQSEGPGLSDLQAPPQAQAPYQMEGFPQMQGAPQTQGLPQMQGAPPVQSSGQDQFGRPMQNSSPLKLQHQRQMQAQARNQFHMPGSGQTLMPGQYLQQGGGQPLEQMLHQLEGSGFPPSQSANQGQVLQPANQNALNQGGAAPSPWSQIFGGGQKQQQQAPAQTEKPGGIFGSAFRTFFGDDSNGAGNASRAQDQAAYAHEAFLRSFHGDHEERYAAYTQAWEAAERARHEAEAAYNKIKQGDANAQTYWENANYYAQQAANEAAQARSNAENTWP